MLLSLIQVALFLTVAAVGLGLWIGVNGLVNMEKKRPMIMITGNLIYTLGLGGYLISTAARFQRTSEGMLELMGVSALLLLLGLFTFSIGFALHGLRNANLINRIQQLELINLAQATELERLQSHPINTV